MKRYYILFAFATLALFSCVMESETLFTNNGGDDKSVVFSLRITSADGTRAADSRTIGETDENSVNTIDVLAFYLDGQGVYRYAYSATDIRRNNMTVTATVKGYSTPQQFVVLVNSSDELYESGINLNDPFEDAMRKLVCTKGIEGQWNARNNGGADFDYIPMYAKTDPVVVDANGKQIGTFPLIRMTARIDVKVRSGVSNFRLVDARLFNQKTAGYVAYDFSDFQTDRAHSAAVPSANTTTGYPIVSGTVAFEADYDQDSKGVIERAIYTYESPAYDKSGGLTGTAIVVGGEYDGKLGYYRINIKTDDDENDDRLSSHILRNHWYIVEIKSVSGLGYENPEDAYKGEGKLTAKVTKWSEMKQNVIGDGQWWLSVSEDELHFQGEGGEVEITAEANYDTEKLNFAVGICIVPDNYDWPQIEDIVGSNGSVFRKIKIKAGENYSGYRTAKIYVQSGNIAKVINVSQSALYVPTAESNCYMVDNNNIKPIIIPVSQVKIAMVGIDGVSSGNGYLGSDWIVDYNKLKVQVLWSDLDKFNNESAVVESVEYISNGAENYETLAKAEIIVTPGTGLGNAGIILYEDNNGNGIYDSTDVIRWSWHIWNSSYYPYDEYGRPNGLATSDQPLQNGDWMDRGVGAMTNKYVSGSTSQLVGFFYQWGRKDPFPYNGSDISYYLNPKSKFGTASAQSGPNMKLAVSNPVTYYTTGVSGYGGVDWYATNTSNINHNLWGGDTVPTADTGFLHPAVNGQRKSVYDPCPVGYKVPSADDWSDLSNTTWKKVNGNNRYSDKYGGYYYLNGVISASYGSSSEKGNFGYYWATTPYKNSSNYGNRGRVLNFGGGIEISVGQIERASGRGIRCRRQIIEE